MSDAHEEVKTEDSTEPHKGPEGDASERRSIATTWIKKHWSNNGMCPVCGHNQWSLPDDDYEIRVFKRGVLSSPVMPVVAIVCTTCGFVELFSAIAMGAVKGVEDPPS